MTLAHAPVTFALGVYPSQGHTFASTHTPWRSCICTMIAVTSNRWHLQLPKQLFLHLHRSYPIGYVCINSWHQAASPSTSGSPRYLYISRLLIICANNCTSPYSNTHPKQRPPITPTCLSTLGHAFGKGLHHNSQAEGLIYAQIVSSPQLQLIKSIASILMHQLHPQYQQDRW